MSKIPVFYRPEQSAKVDSISPSAGKPALMVAAWTDRHPELEVVGFEPIRKEDLYAIHDRAYVDAVFDLTTENGFSTRDELLNESLLYTNGSMLAAAKHVIAYGGVAVSPTSGFHHAEYSEAGAFCTFNGLVLAAKCAVDKGLTVGILDCDAHYGNGTDDILRVLRTRSIRHFSFGRYFQEPGHGEHYLQRLLGLVDEHWFARLDLLIYQASADTHVDDPLGGILTTEEMRQRDRLVFGTASTLRIPLVWNLAGGYQQPVSKVIALHEQTTRACVDIYGRLNGEQ